VGGALLQRGLALPLPDLRLQLPRSACALWFTGGERPLLLMMRLDGAGRASSGGPSLQGYGSPVTLPTCSDRWCEEDGWCPYWGRLAGSPLSGKAPSPAASSLSAAAWCCGRDVLCTVSATSVVTVGHPTHGHAGRTKVVV
jgi:hypothetical protein